MTIDERTVETVEVLAGERPRAIEQAAVRLADLAGLMTLTSTLQSAAAAGAAPTKAEHDALVRDVAAIHNRLTAVIDALRVRLIGNA